MESLNSLYKREIIDFHKPWEGVIDVAIATMEWVAWYNNERIHSYCGDISLAEFEEWFHKGQTSDNLKADSQAK